MSDIYLAHAAADGSKALLLADALQRRDWTVTRRDSNHDEWDPGAHAALVVLWSRHALGLSSLEWAAAEAAQRRKLVQALVGDVRPPRGFRRGDIADLIDWDGGDGDPGLADLVTALRKTVAAGPEVMERLAEPETAPAPTAVPAAAVAAARRLIGEHAPARLTGHTGEVYDLAISADGKLLATASADRTARFWDLPGGTSRAVLAGHDDEVNDVALSPDGRLAATASDDGSVGLWTVPAGKLQQRLDHHDEDPVFAVAFAPSGGLAASADEAGFVSVWRAETGKDVWMLEHERGVSVVRFLPDGTVLAVGDDGGGVALWDMESGEPLGRIDAHDTGIADLAVAPSGIALATSCEAAELGVWHGDGSLAWWADDVAGAVYGLAYSPDGELLAASDDEGIVLWAATPGEPVARIDDPDATRLEFSPTGHLLAWASGTEVRVLRG